jgi:hypothetical protein
MELMAVYKKDIDIKKPLEHYHFLMPRTKSVSFLHYFTSTFFLTQKCTCLLTPCQYIPNHILSQLNY